MIKKLLCLAIRTKGGMGGDKTGGGDIKWLSPILITRKL
jgi:hypothetical protein